jgi:single-strand DNA-binding protein
MALNKVTLQGNIARDIELLQTNNGGVYLKNSIACQRNYAKEGMEKQTDFISILAYGKTAEFLQKNFSKGKQILIEGRIQTGNYDKEDGTKVYTTDVIVEQVYFCGKKEETKSEPTVAGFEQAMAQSGMDFTTNNSSDDLPF